jgi:hypothetical protein
MATLTPEARQECWAEYMRTFHELEHLSITKLDLRAAFDACDQWVNDNALAFNQTLPQPARGAMTASQKSRMLTFIAKWRYDRGV